MCNQKLLLLSSNFNAYLKGMDGSFSFGVAPGGFFTFDGEGKSIIFVSDDGILAE